MGKTRGGGFWDTVRTAFALGIGFTAATFIFSLVGVLLMVAGYILLNREQKKPEKEQRGWVKVAGFALMGLGVAALGGYGLAALLSEASEVI